MLIAPLALLALVFGRKKTRTKFDQFVILFVIVVSVGLSVSIFGGDLIVKAVPVGPYNGPTDPNPYIPLDYVEKLDQSGTNQGTSPASSGTAVNTPTPKCPVTPPYPSGFDRMFSSKLPAIYWNGMTSSQLGAYQKHQGTRNDCAIYSIAAALNLLEKPAKQFDGLTIALNVDSLWKAGQKELRLAPNSATFPNNQIAIINYLNNQYSMNYSASVENTGKELLRHRLKDNNSLQLVTFYFSIFDLPTMIQTNAKNKTNVNLGLLPPVSGHTMVLVVYDPENVYAPKNQVYPWGFINSWSNGGEIWWLSNGDLALYDVVEIHK